MQKGLAISLAVNVLLLVLLQFAWERRGPPTAEVMAVASSSLEISPDGTDGSAVDDTLVNPKQPTSSATAVNLAKSAERGEKIDQHPAHIPVFSSPLGSVPHGGTAFLAHVEQLWPLKPGRAFINSSHETTIRPVLQVPSNVRRICIDVGTFLQSPTARLWWSRDPTTFVVAFEPNKFSVALMTKLAHPIMMSQMTGYWPHCSARAERNRELEERLDRLASTSAVTPAALSLETVGGEPNAEAMNASATANSNQENGSRQSSADGSDASGGRDSGERQDSPRGSAGSRAAVSYSMMQDCTFQMWGHITSHTDRFLLVPVALSATDYFSSFQVGLKNRADMGSLLNFKKSLKKKKGIAHEHEDRILASVAKLSHILQLLPSHEETSGNPILWDTLKIDAQGVDSLIIAGAGPLLAHFVCIIGEFDTRAYDTNQVFRYRQYLKDLLFVRAGQTVFVNLRYAQLFLKKMVICKAPDLKTRWHRMATVVREALKISRRAGGLKVLVNQSAF